MILLVRASDAECNMLLFKPHNYKELLLQGSIKQLEQKCETI